MMRRLGHPLRMMFEHPFQCIAITIAVVAVWLAANFVFRVLDFMAAMEKDDSDD